MIANFVAGPGECPGMTGVLELSGQVVEGTEERAHGAFYLVDRPGEEPDDFVWLAEADGRIGMVTVTTSQGGPSEVVRTDVFDALAAGMAVTDDYHLLPQPVLADDAEGGDHAEIVEEGEGGQVGADGLARLIAPDRSSGTGRR